ncbi:hypothetical protein BJY04DRAFT_216235 [Aspergillus karnatakaensis]|uniref:uncharacterized protein n=1 Tax=Aspergillus karnatakaensis TaxID=1810916 RepID=UPI003CCDAA84
MPPAWTGCQACRERLMQCDQTLPVCGPCQESNIECTFVEQQNMVQQQRVAELESNSPELEHFTSIQDWRAAVSEDVAAFEAQGLPPEDSNFSNVALEINEPPVAANTNDGANRRLLRADDTGLTPTTALGYCSIWFDKYHPWFPIFHRDTVHKRCQNLSSESGIVIPLIYKAMAAAVVHSCTLDRTATILQQRRLSEKMRDKAILAGMRNASIESLQALLIISIIEYGDGRTSQFSSLITICRRMGAQIGLHDLVTYHCLKFGAYDSSAPPQVLCRPTTAVELEGYIRAFWAMEAIGLALTLGAAWSFGISKPELAESLPCNDDIWRSPAPLVSVYRFEGTGIPSSFSLYIRLVTHDLWYVHDFLQQSYNVYSNVDGKDAPSHQAACLAVDKRLNDWKNCFEDLLNADPPPYEDLAMIFLHQRYIAKLFTENKPQLEFTDWPQALTRCHESATHMASIIVAVHNRAFEIATPLIIIHIFTAARFLIVSAKKITGHKDGNSSEDVDTLVRAMEVLSLRWPLADYLQRALNTAIEECHRERAADAEFSPDSASPGPEKLPTEFWNLQYLAPDIVEVLKRWSVRIEHAQLLSTSSVDPV